MLFIHHRRHIRTAIPIRPGCQWGRSWSCYRPRHTSAFWWLGRAIDLAGRSSGRRDRLREAEHYWIASSQRWRAIGPSRSWTCNGCHGTSWLRLEPSLYLQWSTVNKQPRIRCRSRKVVVNSLSIPSAGKYACTSRHFASPRFRFP